MAANYWASTQYRHWSFTRQELAAVRRPLETKERSLIQQYPLPERRLLSIFFREQITKLGRRLQLRQQAQATAQIYVRRYYSKVEVRRTNPYLVLATALYVAAKMEECPQHIRGVVNEARNAWPDFVGSDSSKLGECEFSLIAELNSQLIVHHPYRTLSDIQAEFPLSTDEVASAWAVINDHYLTDLPMLYAPHVIAVTAIFLVVALKAGAPSVASLKASASSVASLGTASTSTGASGAGGAPAGRLQEWMMWVAQSEVDMEAVTDCTQELVSLYEVWEQYNERTCKEQIARFVKARGLDKSA
ncbi:MAG: RNA polymerase II holoenzyme cyclin-like subunit [Phylliscum demangeonii]|nr:MAG: RNA polymerase II holoenzyme cyclin-like subunit [Phylliscum demangeonii]